MNLNKQMLEISVVSVAAAAMFVLVALGVSIAQLKAYASYQPKTTSSDAMHRD